MPSGQQTRLVDPSSPGFSECAAKLMTIVRRPVYDQLELAEDSATR